MPAMYCSAIGPLVNWPSLACAVSVRSIAPQLRPLRAIGSGYYGLAIIGELSSVVSVFFYLAGLDLDRLRKIPESVSAQVDRGEAKMACSRRREGHTRAAADAWR